MPAIFHEITSAEGLDEVLLRSHERPVAVVKHSNTCGISANILYDLREIEHDIHVIVVQQHRDISNEIAARLGYRHQSPQAFVIRDGKVSYHATHYGIDPAAIDRELNS